MVFGKAPRISKPELNLLFHFHSRLQEESCWKPFRRLKVSICGQAWSPRLRLKEQLTVFQPGQDCPSLQCGIRVTSSIAQLHFKSLGIILASGKAELEGAEYGK